MKKINKIKNELESVLSEIVELKRGNHRIEIKSFIDDEILFWSIRSPSCDMDIHNNHIEFYPNVNEKRISSHPIKIAINEDNIKMFEK